MQAETPLLKAIRVAINRDGRARVVRNNVGLAIPYGRPGARPMIFGVGRGSPDLVGILRGSGKCFCLEIKTATGVVEPEQRTWHAAFRRFGGYVAVVRSVAEALAALDQACS